MPPIASVDVPASSANLGSGYDAFAVALSLKLRVELHVGDETGIVLNAHGEGVPRPDDEPDSNLIIRAFREGMRAAHGTSEGIGSWRLEVSSMIPAARGLGSSAAAIVAGLLLGASVGRSAPSADDLLALAARLEGHPDNVAAALYGGFTLAMTGDRGGLAFRRFRVPEAWIPVVYISGTASRTADAGLLSEAMRDALHQPYRLPRLPGTAELIDLAYERGAAGASLSGAGPSVVAICDSPITAHAVEKAWNASGQAGMATRLRFDTSGARLQAATPPEDAPTGDAR